MKHLSLILSGCALAGVAALFYLHFSSVGCFTGSSCGPKTADGDSTVNKQDNFDVARIAYINTDTLWDNYQLVLTMQEEMAEEKLKMEGQFDYELKKLEKEFTEFQKQASYMGMEEGKRKQAELMEKEQQLMKMEERLNRKFTDNEKKRNLRIQKNIRDFLDSYSKEQGFQYILGYNLYGNVFYADSILDVTNEVVEGLNKEYQSEVTDDETSKEKEQE